jgi:hypothetical protein
LGGSMFKISLDKNSGDPILTNGWVQWHVPVLPARWRNTKRRITIQVSPSIKWDPISKITNTQRVEGMAQVVECLPRKHEALVQPVVIWKKKNLLEERKEKKKVSQH